ncbi:MAG: hypothetical protein J0L97_03800 [Alphaproteobacteria bacterium]|nr:hypothetical protein [Alphaproteobacteria bacterium]
MANFTRQLAEKALFYCVLFKGQTPNGEACFAYVGIHHNDLIKALDLMTRDAVFNPKNHHGMVLARGLGEPSKELRAYMRQRFRFSEDSVAFFEQ